MNETPEFSEIVALFNRIFYMGIKKSFEKGKRVNEEEERQQSTTRRKNKDKVHFPIRLISLVITFNPYDVLDRGRKIFVFMIMSLLSTDQ